MYGNIFDIQRFSVHDGPGIRTTVFFKGCPLRCVWCHNPESQISDKSIAYYEDKCIRCGECVSACVSGCHSILPIKENEAPRHVFTREKCLRCGKCIEKCHTGAMEMLGRRLTVSEIMDEVLRDLTFYKNSSGGLTVSGGEPLMQGKFLTLLLSKAKASGINTCIETCGYGNPDVLKTVATLTDIFLFDIKETDSERHKVFTGVPLQPIIDNLRMLDDLGARIILRCPVIPEKNLRDEHLDEIVKLAASLKNVAEINIMAYHTLGAAKYGALSLVDEMKGIPAMTVEQKKECIQKITDGLSDLGVNGIKVS